MHPDSWLQTYYTHLQARQTFHGALYFAIHTFNADTLQGQLITEFTKETTKVSSKDSVLNFLENWYLKILWTESRKVNALERWKVLHSCLHATEALSYSKPVSLFQSNPFQMAPFTATDSNPLHFVVQEKLFQLLVIYVTCSARRDIKATFTSWNLPVLKLHWCLPQTSTGSSHAIKRKIAEPPLWPGATPSLKDWAFLLFRTPPNFSLSLFKEQQQALGPLGPQRGYSPVGVGHTSHSMHKRPAGGKTHTEGTENSRVRGRGVSIWKVLLASRQGLSLCENNLERWSRREEAKNRGGTEAPVSFMQLGKYRGCSKSLGLCLNYFYFDKSKTKVMGYATNWEKIHTFRRHVHLCSLRITRTIRSAASGGKTKLWICKSLRRLDVEGEDGAVLLHGAWSFTEGEEPRVSLQTPPRTSNATPFHQPQTTQGHIINATNRWRIGRGRRLNNKGGGAEEGGKNVWGAIKTGYKVTMNAKGSNEINKSAWAYKYLVVKIFHHQHVYISKRMLTGCT